MDIQDRIGKYLATNRSWYTRNVNTIKVFSVHHDAIPHDNRTPDEVMKSIFGIHNGQKGWPGMSYHYYIHRDGQIFQVNKHEWVTWIDGINWDAIGIVLNGYFHPDHNNKPTEAQLKSLKFLLDTLATKHPEFPAEQKDVYGHRERASTACPGNEAFPYVKEYREKLGQVSWETLPPTPPTSTIPEVIEDQEQKIKILGEVKHIREVAEILTNNNKIISELSTKINNARTALS